MVDDESIVVNSFEQTYRYIVAAAAGVTFSQLADQGFFYQFGMMFPLFVVLMVLEVVTRKFIVPEFKKM